MVKVNLEYGRLRKESRNKNFHPKLPPPGERTEVSRGSLGGYRNLIEKKKKKDTF